MKVKLFKPIQDKNIEALFIKVLAAKTGVNINIFKALLNYFKIDFYFILSEFAGENLKIPTIQNLNYIHESIVIYTEIKSKCNDNTVDLEKFSDILSELALKYNCSINQIYTRYKEIEKIFSTIDTDSGNIVVK